MNRKQLLLFLSAIVIAAVCALIYVVGLKKTGATSELSGQSSPPSRMANAGSVLSEAQISVSAAVGAARASLPSAHIPVVQIYQELSVRAKSGDSAAACRLSADLMKCASRKLNLAAAQNITNAMSSGGASADARTVDHMAAVLNQADNDLQMCDGVTGNMLASAYDLQSLAAQGDPGKYERWLAANPGLDRQNFLSQIDLWRDYRIVAKRYYSKLMRARDLSDIPLLLAVYAPDSVMGVRPPYREDDLNTFLALHKVAEDHGIKISSDIDLAAKLLLKNYNQRTLPADVLTGWSGIAPKDGQKELIEAMYPDTVSGSFCTN